jgi:putative acetyltransferase
VIVRRSRRTDVDEIASVHGDAFGRVDERDLAVALLSDGSAVPELSLVAEWEGTIVGHVVCSRCFVDGSPALGLGPIGISSTDQRRGAGSALMHAVIGAADALGEPLIALLGSPDYYGRFGFVPSLDLGIAAPDPAWRASFQVRTLTAYDPTVVGIFTYAPAFGAISQG